MQTFTKVIPAAQGSDSMDFTPPFVPDFTSMSATFTDMLSSNGIDTVYCMKESANSCRIRWDVKRARQITFTVNQIAPGQTALNVQEPPAVVQPSPRNEDD